MSAGGTDATRRGPARVWASGVRDDVWGARAGDYAELDEDQHHRLFNQGLRMTNIGRGTAVLDLGCGPGAFCRLAAQAGALVTGLGGWCEAGALGVTGARSVVAQGDGGLRSGRVSFRP